MWGLIFAVATSAKSALRPWMSAYVWLGWCVVQGLVHSPAPPIPWSSSLNALESKGSAQLSTDSPSYPQAVHRLYTVPHGGSCIPLALMDLIAMQPPTYLCMP